LGNNWTFKTKVVSDVQVINNKLIDPPDDGIESLVITDFLYKDNYGSGSGDDCYSMIKYSNNGYVSGNTCERGRSRSPFGSAGFEIEDAAYSISLVGNIARYGPASGFNLIMDAGSYTMGVKNISLIGNIAHDNGSAGISVGSNDTDLVMERIEIIGNQLYSNGTTASGGSGLVIERLKNGTISGNNLYANAPGSGSGRGITIQNSTNVKIVNNDIRGNGGSGLYWNVISNSLLGGNTFYENSQASNGGREITFAGASNDNKITDNLIDSGTSDKSYGIILGSGVTRTLVEGNNFLRSRLDANYYSDSGTGTVFKNNWISNSPTEAEGVADVDCGTAVTHGLYGTPDYVFITAGDTGAADIYASSIGATQFTISCTDTGDNAYNFSWRAVYLP
jgi:parallel beta-helix repeat protein